VVDTPEHIVLAVPALATRGLVPVTFTVTLPEAVHVLASETVTKYEVVDEGVAVKLAPLPPPVHV